jgi:mannitol/fructose-specific phosphotransferase system IIA component (Ntr-type)
MKLSTWVQKELDSDFPILDWEKMDVEVIKVLIMVQQERTQKQIANALEFICDIMRNK